MSLNELKMNYKIVYDNSWHKPDFFFYFLFLAYTYLIYVIFFTVVNWLGKCLGDSWNLNDRFYVLNYQFLYAWQFICNVIGQISTPFTHPSKQLYMFLDRTALAVSDNKPWVDNTAKQVVFVVCATIQQKLYIFHPVLTHFGSQAEIRLYV